MLLGFSVYLIVMPMRSRNYFVRSDTSTPMGEMVATMLSAISKMELFNISHRVKSGIANARRKGDGSWGKKSNLTDEVKKQILLKRKEGWGFRKLTKEFKVSNQTLRKFLPENA